jgi:poly(3-hydroxybutyrate) depolymerase
MNSRLLRVLAAAAALGAGAVHAAAPLPALSVDRDQVTVSGISAGAFMANQLGYAYSSLFKGVGMFAGGPYRCAGHNNLRACMLQADITPAQLAAMQADIDGASGARIDAKSHVAAQKVFLFVGEQDRIVGPQPMVAVRKQYADNGVAGGNLEFKRLPQAGHEFPTDFSAAGTTPCGSSTATFIANCGYDGAKAVLTRLYGPLNPRNDAPADANYREFDQAAFGASPGLAATGWVYVPANCAAGTKCRLHVALHGCLQSHGAIGDRFVRNTGYTRWADTNSIVVLFPQASADPVAWPTPASGWLPNPYACFDWVGWYGGNFAERAGAQVAAIKAMVDQLAAAPGAACITDSNYGHTRAGRARALWFVTYANGSNQNMGWWNLATTTTLKQTGPNHYVIGGC